MNVEQVKSIDEAMGLAIEHSYQVKGTTYPKPPVGAVIVDPNGRIVGAGGTEPAGGDWCKRSSHHRIWRPRRPNWSARSVGNPR